MINEKTINEIQIALRAVNFMSEEKGHIFTDTLKLILSDPKSTAERLWNKYLDEKSKLFSSVFKQVDKVKYDPSWENGTGYLDNAVKYELQPGKIVATTDNMKRDIILIGTRWGTVAIFYRYENNNRTIVKNYPKGKKIQQFISQENEHLVLSDLKMILGFGKEKITDKNYDYKHMNIGEKLEYLFS
jgi:hypothetical protein